MSTTTVDVAARRVGPARCGACRGSPSGGSSRIYTGLALFYLSCRSW